ncbi:AfsR/SARP family transcriptional regulator [Streptomyces griseocarneus]|uniref:AfsR/SARP family transcriptional regulator n=1 Tax=Streptomyces griseocarneus TaxID=51201 RepID=UPI00167CDE56|nr:BTAD domain-containing putative transcriptional regulator [Streptomyces griseocarneus]MBZ6477761.1 winged helix-turn-helix domain-containing protein [Streptomyces griseocarneus]GHG61217.1 SARP family transcriptional regulator [Streptomyces griseocarneus]
MELPRVEFKVLGPLEAVADGRTLPLGGPRQRTLLATLLVNADIPVTADRLCDAIWGQAPPASAQANVRSYVAALRKTLGPGSGEDRLGLGHRGYQLRVRPDELDLHRFEDLAARGRKALAAADHNRAACHLREALDLWRGDAFDGVAHNEALHIEAVRLEEARLTVVEDYAEARLALGEHREAAAMLREQTALHPLRESLWAKLMLAQYRSHRPGDALRSYALARAALREELGLEPGDELRRLHRAVLVRDPALGTAPAPVRPARPLPAWRTVSQLPADIADFVGRDLVMSRAAALLEPTAAPPVAAPAPGVPSPAAPVVILTGPPGVGKTALAVRLAHLLRHAFPDGRLFLRLDGTRGPRRPAGAVLAELLRSLGVAASSLPEVTVDRAAMLRLLLSGRKVLVVLDDARDEDQIRPLLSGIPGCAVLVTGRTRPAVAAGAHIVDVAPLDDAESRLLLRRTAGPHRLEAEPEATDWVVAGCAGLPLALRVAGAALAVRPHWRVSCLADRLAGAHDTPADPAPDDSAPDDPAVRAAVATAYRGLPADAARAFRAIGLLPSPRFPGWALAALLDADDHDGSHGGAPSAVLDVLLDAHLVQAEGADAQGRPRYRTHDLLHAYAAERALAEEPPHWRREATARVLDACLTRVRAAGDQLIRGEPGDLVRGGPGDLVGWLESERDGLVTLVEFAAATGHGPHVAALASALEDVCHLRNWWDEWDRVARAALDRAEADGDPVAVAVAQGSLARARAVRGHVDDAVTRWEQAVERLDALGEPHHAARLRTHRSFAVADRGMAELAHDDARSAAEAMSRLGDAHGRILALRSLGYALVCLGRQAEAVLALEPALETAERLGHPLLLADVLQLLAVAEIGRGRLGRAARQTHRALAGYRMVRHRPGEAYALVTLGRIHVRLGSDQAPRALGPLAEAASIFTELGERRGEALTSYWLGKAHAALGETARATSRLAEALTGFRVLRMPFWAETARRELGDLARAATPPGRGPEDPSECPFAVR